MAKWTGIPVTKMLESDRERLTRLEDELGQRVVGQRAARDGGGQRGAAEPRRSAAIPTARPARSFSSARPAWERPRPRGRWPSSCSTTNGRMVRLDMSEYMEKHSVARMIGAPPGYVGYEEGGQLTEAVRRRPYSVILFDEIEKAHPDVFNVLLQILDDGRLTDSQGRLVDFRNTVIIMTINIGSAAHPRGRAEQSTTRRGARWKQRCGTSCERSLPARVPQPGGRHRRLPAAEPGRTWPASWICSWPGCAKQLAARGISSSTSARGARAAGAAGLRSGVRRPAAQAGDPAAAAEPDRAASCSRATTHEGDTIRGSSETAMDLTLGQGRGGAEAKSA